MEQWLEIISNFYPITLSIVIIFIYLWNLLDTLKKYDTFKNWIGYLILVSLIIHGIAFYANYGLEDKFWIIWALRDLLFIILSILVFENKKLAIANFIFWIAVGVYYGLQLKEVQENILKFETTQTITDEIEADTSAELLVTLKKIENLSQLEALLNKLQIKYEIHPAFSHLKSKDITNLDNVYTINLSSQEDANKVYELLVNSQLIETIEWNETLSTEPIEEEVIQSTQPSTFSSINDERSIDQWALKELEIDKLTNLLRKIKPKKIAKIFILDTGVDADHEDLKENYFSVNPNYDKDTDIHGTHCAGIAASVTNNRKGIASLNFNNRFCKITSITVIPNGSGTQEQVIDGMILAADLGADVISMSLGGPSNDKKQKLYEEAVDYCNKKGAIVVVAAGNSNQDAKYHAPACCKNTITVAAVDEELRKARFSNYFTEQKYPISAPGVNILSTVPNDKYQPLNGTSMATPYVASIIGIMKSIQPDLTTDKAYEILNSTAIHLESNIGNFIQPADAIKELTRKKSSYHWLIEWIIKLFTFKL